MTLIKLSSSWKSKLSSLSLLCYKKLNSMFLSCSWKSSNFWNASTSASWMTPLSASQSISSGFSSSLSITSNEGDGIDGIDDFDDLGDFLRLARFGRILRSTFRMEFLKGFPRTKTVLSFYNTLNIFWFYIEYNLYYISVDRNFQTFTVA